MSNHCEKRRRRCNDEWSLWNCIVFLALFQQISWKSYYASLQLFIITLLVTLQWRCEQNKRRKFFALCASSIQWWDLSKKPRTLAAHTRRHECVCEVILGKQRKIERKKSVHEECCVTCLELNVFYLSLSLCRASHNSKVFRDECIFLSYPECWARNQNATKNIHSAKNCANSLQKL